ncbi:ImmA/IrrE family metallo-endopeptidase [Actinoplanes sp. TFC3]|uniref:helix-turn-helix domain-containing protein n=1 Tax=Actinoplanes sp. TFC3 TaxID=1710355 RepID=UPI001F1DC28A|nr:XRE family transcriptional regulator [Actinoplanes sp. TFC3]
MLSEHSVGVGQRIRAAREARGWSQGALASRLGRTQTAVSYWESGNRALALDDLIAVAEVLGVSTASLLPDSRSQRSAPALLRAVAERVDAGQLADELEEFALKAQVEPRLQTKWNIEPASPRDTAEALLAIAGINDTPVPVVELATGCGIRVLPWSFDNVDGLVVDLDNGPTIAYNRSQPHTRQRFTIAHELGHHLLRHTDRFYVDFGNELAPLAAGDHPGYDWRAERSANEFAANILMPSPMIRQSFGQTPDVRALAKRFDVSSAAMSIRLTALRLK